MKKITILFIISLVVFQVNAQVKFGIMTGKSPSHIPAGMLEFSDGIDSSRIDVRSPNAPWLFGPYLRLKAGRVFFQSGLLLGFSTLDYEVENLQTDELTVIRDFEWHLDMPIEVGFFFSDRLFIKAGILGANYFQHEKENGLLSFDDKFRDIFRNRNYGYRIGLGFDIDNPATISLSYTNFRNIQNSIVVYEKVDYDFEFREHQIMVNFNWNFIKNR